jgi:hypothetical protein
MRIHATHPCGFRASRVGIEMDHLATGMHAPIGAACASGAYGGSGDRGERRLERVLHRAAARLCLPAEKATAVVLQSEGDAQD